VRILFVSHTHLKKELGASKVVMELGDEFERMGWTCDFLSLAELTSGAEGSSDERYAHALRGYLREHADRYDVIDYDHGHLPFPRREFPAQTLMVARSVLLSHHFMQIAMPHERRWKARLRAWLDRRRWEVRKQEIFRRARITLLEADVVNVSNDHDKVALVRDGIPADKIIVAPYGLSRERQVLFDGIRAAPPDLPVIAFVGTFDVRKGSTDFPAIVRGIADRIPEASFRLFGTNRPAREILADFPRSLRHRIQVTPHYAPESLPELLAPCSVGVFPSYIEGFGFGVLEMLAAGLPVVAYDAPGPPMMLPSTYLVRPGDTTALSTKVVGLLSNRAELSAAREWAKQRAHVFSWPAIAGQTSDFYRERWQKLQTRTAAS
jgi:glycosyltransferase involved in cell wall biosynthesis